MCTCISFVQNRQEQSKKERDKRKKEKALCTAFGIVFTNRRAFINENNLDIPSYYRSRKGDRNRDRIQAYAGNKGIPTDRCTSIIPYVPCFYSMKQNVHFTGESQLFFGRIFKRNSSLNLFGVLQYTSLMNLSNLLSSF